MCSASKHKLHLASPKHRFVAACMFANLQCIKIGVKLYAALLLGNCAVLYNQCTHHVLAMGRVCVNAQRGLCLAALS
jgi:hypothetical protein